jgi:sugar diacid utilization regulator
MDFMAWTGDINVLLTDSVLEMRTLDKVMAYLQEAIGRQVIITDYKGMVHATSEVNSDEFSSDRYLSLPDWKNTEPLFYDETTRRLYYRIGCGDKGGFIIVNDVKPECCGTYRVPLDKSALAVKTFLAQAAVMESTENLYTNNFLKDVLLRNINIKDLMKGNYALLNLDLNSLYYICIMEPEKSLTQREMHTLHSYTREWLTHNNLDIFCTVWDNKYLVFICPTHYDKKTLEVDYGWDKHLSNIKRYHKEVRIKFSFPASLGIGNKYTISKLHRSYQEALFSLHLSKLTGKGDLVSHISDLGVFTLICSNDLIDIKHFYNKYLGPVLDFDRSYDRNLLDSLRCFFDANLDVKETADRLHLHINSLRYRLKKIEELSGMNLQKMEDRANLYVALKVYDLLLSTGFMK